MRKRALITGITGMDGSHLADLLISKDYEVFGLVRRLSSLNLTNLSKITGKYSIISGDLTDQNSLYRAIYDCDPHEIYNLAALSFVKESWASPESTSLITGLGCLKVLEAIREYRKPIKFYQASSSEMFGNTGGVTVNEDTPFYPCSPYGVSKLFAHWMTINYRESYNMFNSCGILFNHESERRGHEFVTRKITDGVAKISLGLEDKLYLGNLDAMRDWGYSPEYVEAMWLMLQQPDPNNFIVATGKTYSVRHFLDLAFGLIGVCDWSKYVVSSKDYNRPLEVDYLCGDASKAKSLLGWTAKTTIDELIKKMLDNDIRLNSL